MKKSTTQNVQDNDRLAILSVTLFLIVVISCILIERLW